MLGAMIAFLMKEPRSERDRDHTLRTVFLVPLPTDAAAFAERFGVRVFTNYNSTETCNAIVSDANPEKVGLCGRPRDGITARIVDENDIELPPGKSANWSSAQINPGRLPTDITKSRSDCARLAKWLVSHR